MLLLIIRGGNPCIVYAIFLFRIKTKKESTLSRLQKEENS